MPKTIPYSTQWIDKDDIKAVTEVLKSDWITQGPKIAEFESAIARYVGAKFGVAVNSGTSALLSACFAAGIKKDDEVITTPYTFSASANCFVWLGATPVFVDIEEKTLNINAKKIEKAVTKKTKAILTVDFAGAPCKYDEILKIAKKHNLVVIDDAAHALGSQYRDKKLGTIVDLTCFSFHPVKTITTGEGGMMVTNSEKFYQKLLLFRNHGITKDEKFLTKNEGGWYYEMRQLGLNFRFTDIQAALGFSQLKKIEKFIERRREIVEIYNKAFANLPVILPFEPENTKSAWHLYPIRLKLEKLKVTRRKIFEELQKAGLGVQVHYIPIHLQPYYMKTFGTKAADFPIAEKAYQEEISLPLYPKMTNSQINYVIKTFTKILKKNQIQT